MREAGTAMPMAAITVPAGSRTGAAMPQIPDSPSSLVKA
jgi:hypothetical protein